MPCTAGKQAAPDHYRTTESQQDQLLNRPAFAQQFLKTSPDRNQPRLNLDSRLWKKRRINLIGLRMSFEAVDSQEAGAERGCD